MVEDLYELKWEYNNTLTRYYNGCNYIEEHTEETEKYLLAVQQLLHKLEDLLKQIQYKQEVSDGEILGGFRLC